MNTAFAQAIEHWHDFFLLAGGASATLVGLLFIAASLHVEIFGDETASRARLAATQALTNFFIALTLSLVFLVPNQSPQADGVTLIILALIGLTRLTLIAIQQFRGKMAVRPSSLVLYYYILPLGYNVSMLYVAATVLAGDASEMGWLVWVIIFILINATGTAWSMMTQLSVFRRESNTSKS